MQMKFSSSARFLLLILVSVLFLTGCTPEKAEALLSAAKAFQNEAKKAIAAYEELLMAGLDTPRLSEKEAVADIIYRANYFLGKEEIVTFVGITRGLQDPLSDGKAEIKAFVQRQQSLYDAFADSLTNLPRGSYFAGEHVQCAEEIARRLVINIANYREAVKRRPVSLVAPEEAAVDTLEKALKNRKGTDVEKNEGARRVYELFNRKAELNNKLIAQATVAAETGLQVVKAAREFNTLSAEDIIKLVRQALAIAGGLEGLDTSKAVGRLDKAVQDARGDAHWQKILDLEIYQAGTKCNPAKQEDGVAQNK